MTGLNKAFQKFLRTPQEQVELQLYLPQGLDGLEVEQLTIDTVIQWVADWRCRPIELVPRPLPAGLYGARLAGPSRDYIIYEQNTALVHQDHIKAHELGHILAEHPIVPVTADTTLEEIIAHLRAEQENSYEEQEAEAVATAIQNEIIRLAGLRALTRQVATTPLWEELVYGLGLDR